MFGWQTVAVAYPHSGTAFVAAVNHWSALSPISSMEILELESFVEKWLKRECVAPDLEFTQDWIKRLEARNGPSAPAMENARWKTLYLRWLLFAESYRSPVLWDPAVFVTGVSDMSPVPASVQGIHVLAASSKMRRSLQEAREIYPFLGADNESWATSDGLLSVPAELAPQERSVPPVEYSVTVCIRTATCVLSRTLG